MPASRSILRLRSLKPNLIAPLRSLCTSATSAGTSLSHHQPNHQFLPSNQYLNSWRPPKDPREAEAKLARLRRQYAKKLKEVRKEYIHEMELLRLEKQRRNEAGREAIHIANEERQGRS